MPGNRPWARVMRSTIDFLEAGQLRAALIEYFDWATDNPLEEVKPFSYLGNSWGHTLDKPRAFTDRGIRVFLGITKADWDAFRENAEFRPVIEWAEDVMYSQKFELGAADLLNASFIARDIGLTDKRELGGIPGQPLEISAREQLLDELNRLTASASEGDGDGEDGEADGS